MRLDQICVPVKRSLNIKLLSYSHCVRKPFTTSFRVLYYLYYCTLGRNRYETNTVYVKRTQFPKNIMCLYDFVLFSFKNPEVFQDLCRGFSKSNITFTFAIRVVNLIDR